MLSRSRWLYCFNKKNPIFLFGFSVQHSTNWRKKFKN